jgi:hypothetical protein
MAKWSDEKMADLTAERDEWRKAYHKTHDLYASSEERADALTEKLAKAVDVIEWALIAWDDHCKHGYDMQGDWVHDARTTLAELKGQGDE